MCIIEHWIIIYLYILLCFPRSLWMTTIHSWRRSLTLTEDLELLSPRALMTVVASSPFSRLAVFFIIYHVLKIHHLMSINIIIADFQITLFFLFIIKLNVKFSPFGFSYFKMLIVLMMNNSKNCWRSTLGYMWQHRTWLTVSLPCLLFWI